MARKALAGSVFLGVSILFAAGAILVVIPLFAPTATEKHDDLTSALLRAGLDPAALAAAGVTAGETSTLVGLVDAHLQAEEDSLSALDADYASARVTHDQLKRKIQSGKATEAEVSSFPQAATDLATAQAVREAFLDDVVTAGAAQLSADEKSALATIRGNRGWKLPVEYLVVDRTEQEWVDLRDALANLRIMPKLGEDVDSACEGHVATCELNTDVADAASSLDSNCAGVEVSWQSAAG